MTPEQAAEAVRYYQSGESIGQVAVRYSVTRQAMHDLLKRRTKMRPQLRFGAENGFFRGGAISEDVAHNLVETAVSRGELVPQPCEVCGTNHRFKDGRRAVQAHHDDYSKPLEVRWLCQKHHHEWHRNNPNGPSHSGRAILQARRAA